MGRAGFRAAQRGRGEVRQPTRLGHPEQAAACALGCAVTASRIVPVVCIQGSAAVSPLTAGASCVARVERWMPSWQAARDRPQ